MSLSARADGRFDVICRNGDYEVRTAEEIRNNQVCEADPAAGLFCASWSGTGLPPFVVASIRGGGVTVYSDVQFSTMGDCRASLTHRIDREEDTYLCGARHHNGSGPWTLYHLGNDATALEALSYPWLSDCVDATRESRVSSARAAVCASREGDGEAPWRPFYLSSTDVIEGTGSYNTPEACFAALDGSDDVSYLCVSRDNDGMRPYVLAQRRGVELTRFEHVVYRTVESCEASIALPLELPLASAWVCASRDRDGLSPYALIQLAEDSDTNALIYRTVEQCFDAIQWSYSEEDGALVCASRDRDGLNPWAIHRIGPGGAQPTDIVFNNLEDCLEAVAP